MRGLLLALFAPVVEDEGEPEDAPGGEHHRAQGEQEGRLLVRTPVPRDVEHGAHQTDEQPGRDAEDSLDRHGGLLGV